MSDGDGVVLLDHRPEDDDGWSVCLRCDGEGFIIICPDGMCQGMGECIHGDGEVICPVCHGEGEVYRGPCRENRQ